MGGHSKNKVFPHLREVMFTRMLHTVDQKLAAML